MTEEELGAYFAFGREQRRVEFKTAGARNDPPFFARVARAMMAMSNTRDGGLVVIGIDDDSLEPVDFLGDALDTWRHDEIADLLKEYAAPFVEFDERVVPFKGKSCLVIRVSEFSDQPVVCVKEFQRPSTGMILQRGSVYVRPLHKSESVPVQSEVDMRELLELAAEKRMRKTLGLVSRAGLLVVPEATGPTSEERFQLQANEILSPESALLKKLRSRGYWRLMVYPTSFNKDRLKDIVVLKKFVVEKRVELRGWYFPHSDKHNPVIGNDWVGSESEFHYLLDAWRLYQSGLFVVYQGLRPDWRDMSQEDEVASNPPGEKRLSIVDVIYTCTEVMEFAARLSLEFPGTDDIVVSMEIVGIDGRRLDVGPGRHDFFFPQIARIERWSKTVSLSRSELVGDAWSHARDFARELFVRFEWENSAGGIADIQNGFRA